MADTDEAELVELVAMALWGESFMSWTHKYLHPATREMTRAQARKAIEIVRKWYAGKQLHKLTPAERALMKGDKDEAIRLAGQATCSWEDIEAERARLGDQLSLGCLKDKWQKHILNWIENLGGDEG